MSNPSFLIFVQRKNGDGDDVIRISRSNIDSSRFRVSYDDETSNATRPREMYLSESEVMEYIDTLITGLSLDKDPFDHFQIMPPAAPSIQFDIADLKNPAVQQAIYSTLQFSMRHWVVQDIPVIRRRPVLNPEEDDAETRDTMSPPRRRRRTSSPSRAHY